MKKSILLIEDEAAQRELVRTVLEPRGFEITEASCGQDAIGYLDKRDFAVIITDLRMSHGSGEFVIEWIVTHRMHLRSRVLVVTGDLMCEGLDILLGRLEIPLLAKPYLLSHLIQSVETIAGKRAPTPSDLRVAAGGVQ